MLFRNASWRSTEDPSKPDSLRTLWPTVAEPSTFAPPIAVEEGDDALTLSFDIAHRTEADIEVMVEGQTLFIMGEALPARRWSARARRALMLPAGVDASKAKMSLASRVLSIHIAKTTSRAIVVRNA